MSFKNTRQDSLFCSSSPQFSSDCFKKDADYSGRKSDSVNEDKSSYNLTDSDSLKLVMADTASVESNVKKVMNQNQDDDNLSSANIVMIMDLEDGQSDHEL